MCWHACGAGALDFECLSIRCIPSWRFSHIFERLWIRCQHFPSEKRLRSGHPTISLSMGVFVSISATLRSLLSIPSHTPLDRSSEGRTVPFSRRRCRKPCLPPAKSRCPHSNRLVQSLKSFQCQPFSRYAHNILGILVPPCFVNFASSH